VDFEGRFDEITNLEESENENCPLAYEYEKENEGLESLNNPFQTWAENIYKESLTYIREGVGINAMFAPNLVPNILKCIKLLPLWSGLMIPIFGYGEVISSSAAVESSFKKLKTVTFKNTDLPVNIEQFLENHIMSLRGASLIRSSANSHLSSALQQTHHINDENIENSPITLVLSSPISEHNDYYENDIQFDENIIKTAENDEDFMELPINNNECPLCSTGVFPTEEGAHKCIKCGIPVHALPSCSGQKSDDETLRICKSCLEPKNSYLNDETTAHETWNRKNKKQKQKSYLTPNPYLRHVNINNSRNTVILPILKNGSRAEELKSCNIKDIRKIIFSNTCAFDTLTFIFMVSYCDSEHYKNYIDGLTFIHPFFKFISNIVKNDITSSTYTERANIILNIIEPELLPLEYNTSLAICNTTAGLVITKMNIKPTVVEDIICSDPKCERNTSHPVVFLTFQTSDGSLNGLQQFLNQRLSTETSVCGYISSKTLLCSITKTIISKLSPFHIFIEVLYWNSKYCTLYINK